MYAFVVSLHIVACIVLVLSVLLQQGKGAEVGAVFGSSEAVFGSSGPSSLLSKITTAVAIVFMVTSLSLTYLAAHNDGGSIMKGIESAPASGTTTPTTVPVDNPNSVKEPEAQLPSSEASGSVNHSSVLIDDRVKGKSVENTGPDDAEKATSSK